MSWEPKFSYQPPTERTCGLHVIAMITHLPYDYIKTFLPKFHGTTTEEVSRSLHLLGYDCDREETRYRKGMVLPDLCVIHVRRHWCLYFKGKIYCSNNGVWPVEQYSKHRRILSYLKVTLPNV